MQFFFFTFVNQESYCILQRHIFSHLLEVLQVLKLKRKGEKKEINTRMRKTKLLNDNERRGKCSGQSYATKPYIQFFFSKIASCETHVFLISIC